MVVEVGCVLVLCFLFVSLVRFIIGEVKDFKEIKRLTNEYIVGRVKMAIDFYDGNCDG